MSQPVPISYRSNGPLSDASTVSDLAGAYQVENSRDQFERVSPDAYTVSFSFDHTALNNTLDQLDEVFIECRIPNWDGNGAVPLSSALYKKAEQFIQALPVKFPVPEIVPEPDGEIAFEWRNRWGRVLSVSLASNGRLTLLYLPERIRTTLPWPDRSPLPPPLLKLVELLA